MKRSIRTVGALGVAGALLMGGVGATAASAAEAGFAVEAYASDGSNQINAAGEFLFDSRKSDEPGSTYEMAYRGTLDMTEYLGRVPLSLRGAWNELGRRRIWLASGELPRHMERRFQC